MVEIRNREGEGDLVLTSPKAARGSTDKVVKRSFTDLCG